MNDDRTMIGRRLNNYEIIREIGAGGMGTVYLALHPFIDRKAAVKVLRPEFSRTPEMANRFLNEARAANAIGHPNIIDIIDAGRLPDGGLPYLMMEFLEGESLASRLKRVGRIAIDDAVDWARQVASALAAAHAKGIVHRDLKPENLYVVPDKRNPGRELIKVLDFGIAKLHALSFGDGVKTQTGAVMGTPPYMSPEQCRGVSDEVDHRTDTYALGIILYEMLCGAPPFMAQGFGDILVQHITQPPEPPQKRNASIPDYLQGLVLRALAKKPEERQGSMLELCTALASPEATGASRGGGVVGAGGAVGASGAVGAVAVGGRRAVSIELAPKVTTVMPVAGSGSSARDSTTFSSAVGQVSGRGGRSRRRWLPLVLGGGAGAAVVVAIIVLGGGGKSDAPGGGAAPGTGTAAAGAGVEAVAAPGGSVVSPTPTPTPTPPASIGADAAAAASVSAPPVNLRTPPPAVPAPAKPAPGTSRKPPSATTAAGREIPAGDALQKPEARPRPPKAKPPREDEAPIKF